jgi:manganese/zinc/iron transport system permease protein
MSDFLLSPWTSGDWMWRGMLSSMLVSLSCSVLGVFLYLRRMSMLSDALAHVALLGIVGVFLLTGSLDGGILLLGAIVVGVGASVLIERLASVPGVRADASVGIVFTSMFALGVILLTTSVQDAHIDMDCALYGNVLGISNRALVMLAISAPVTLVLVAIGFRWLTVSSFDPTLARSLGIPVAAVQYGLMVTVSVAAVSGFEAVGAVLVIAYFVVPAATAHLLVDRMSHMVFVAVAHGLLSCVIGMYGAIWFNCSPAGMMVVAGGGLYLSAFLFAPRHGRVQQWLAGREKERSGPAFR